MAKDLDRRSESVDNDRRLVKRFSDPELRENAKQVQTLLKVGMVALLVVICDQIYLAIQNHSYVTHACFYAVVALMILIQAGSYHASLNEYGEGESASTLVNSFHSQRNFLAMVVFFVVVFTAVTVVSQLH